MFENTFYYGHAIIRLIQNVESITISKYRNNNCFRIENSFYIYLKHSAKRLTPWRFTFTESNLKEILKLSGEKLKLFIVLLCNNNGICCFDFDELSKLIRISSSSEDNKWISISRSTGEKYKVSGSDGELKYKIGDSDFPRKCFTSIL